MLAADKLEGMISLTYEGCVLVTCIPPIVVEGMECDERDHFRVAEVRKEHGYDLAVDTDSDYRAGAALGRMGSVWRSEIAFL